MDTRRKSNREKNEITLQYQSRRGISLEEEANEQKLTQLLTFVSRLERTPPGIIEIGRRIKLFGECHRNDGETSGQFYARLRYWLDKDLPQTKHPLHAPRQLGGD